MQIINLSSTILQKKVLQNNNATQLSQFDENINYKKLLIKEKTKRRKLQIKRELRIAQTRNKFLLKSLCENEIKATSSRRLRENYFDNKISESILKRQRFACFIKLTQLNLYYKKNFKNIKELKLKCKKFLQNQ